MTRVRRVLSPNELEAYWSGFEKLFTRCAKNSHDPVFPGDIKRMVLNREAEIFYTVNEANEVVFALAAQPTHTVRGFEYFIMAMSGVDLKDLHETVFKDICTWMRLNGAVSVEAYSKLPMCRMLQRNGWNTVCTTMHFDL